jgi:hypothetical protein
MNQVQDNASLLEQIALLTAENEALKAKKQRTLSLKVSDKGALSVYGMGRFPVTLYPEQWMKLIGISEDIKNFINEHKAEFSVKEKAANVLKSVA